MTKKIILLGIDGGDWDIIRDFVGLDRLPNFYKIINKGIAIKMKTIPPWTPAMWTSIITGKKLENHGISSFLKIDRNYAFKMCNSNDKKVASIWDFFNTTCIVQNCPFTYPATTNNRVKMITGMMTPSINKKSTSDDDIYYLLKDLNYIFESTSDINDLLNSLKNKIEINKILLKKFEDWELNLFIIRETDIMQHNYWDQTIFYKIYSLIDDYIGYLIKNYPESIIIVVSDHGFKEITKKFGITNFLISHKYIFLNNRYKFNKLIRSLYNILPKVIKSKIIKKYILNKYSNDLISNIDLKKTKVIPGGWGELYLNTTFFKNGFIKPEDKNIIIDEIIKSINSFNKDILYDLIKIKDCKENYYKFPDAYFIPNSKNKYALDITLDGPIYSECKNKGEHYVEGIFICYGLGHISVDGFINVCDVTPTILDIKKIKYDPNIFDGKSIFKK